MAICACMPAGLSRYNSIEHLWSPCSKFLAGESLSACLPGESTPAAQQSVPAEEKDEKEEKIFDNALDRLDTWDGKVHDVLRISSRGVTLGEHGGTIGGYEITKMFQSSKKSIRDDEQFSAILEEWKVHIRTYGLTIWLRLLQERQLRRL